MLDKFKEYDPSPSLNRILAIPSQVLRDSVNNQYLDITLDSGATVSYLRHDDAVSLGAKILPNNQLALLADHKTRMASLGEVDLIVTVSNIQMRLRALVMRNLQAHCFGGTTFHVDNGIEAKIKEGTITIHGKYTVKQANPFINMPIFPPPAEKLTVDGNQSDNEIYESTNYASQKTPSVEPKLNAISLPSSHVIFPSECLQIPIPPDALPVSHLSITPSFPGAHDNPSWSPQICDVVNGHAVFTNFSNTPLVAPKYAHFRPHPVLVMNINDAVPDPSHRSINRDPKSRKSSLCKSPPDIRTLLSLISVNTSIMSADQITRFNSINQSYSNVFDNNLSGGYNHHAGQFYADFSFSSKPPPTRIYVPQYNKKCSDLQQAKCDELEAQGVLVDPKLHNVPILHVSPSWIQQKGRAKNKSLQDCSLDELRFITAFNTLNDFIRPKPTSSCSANSIFKFLARWPYHIYADLNNSYFQIPVQKKLWSYLGIMTPYKGVRVLTRTGQGLLGSDVELEELLSRILGEDIADGYCMNLRDDIIIGGNTIYEALSHYESVLRKLHQNNLKLSPNKVRVFPEDTEIYGYRIKSGKISPSDHTVTSLGKTQIDELVTVKQVNSWKGLYKTLIGHLPALSNVMSPFDSATGGKNPSEKFDWTPALTSSFNTAMSHLSQINETFLPKPSEQLILLPDAMSTSPCVGWVLYVMRDDKLLPVMYCNAKLKEYMLKWFPCEKEATGVVLAVDQCAHWISESEKTTLVGPDCLAVVKAVDLIRKGRHSSNPRLQSLLASVNRRNIKFFHNSAKAGFHIVPDSLSRMPDTTCRSKDCAIERFLDDIPVQVEAMSTIDLNETSLLSLCLEESIPHSAVLAATSSELAEQLIQRSGPIPLGSRPTWIQVQKSDPDCRIVYNLKNVGEIPRKKSTNPQINRIFKEAMIDKGLLVVRSFDNCRMREIDKVVVPPSFLDSILTVLHLKLNHPTQFQLKQVFDRYFFSPRLEQAASNLYDSCHLCAGLKKFPKMLELYEPKLFPDHPGSAMNADIMKRSGQLILVNIDLFSGYVTACFASSEKSEDLATAIIQAVTPIRTADPILLRVDKAPGLLKLASSPHSLLNDVGIKIELAEDENKNSNCCVDKAIDELETELRKISPDGMQLNSAELAQAVMSLNNKIRKRGLSAAEIHFSRDAYNHDNLHLDDAKLQQQQKSFRLENHQHLAHSRAPKGRPINVPSPSPGDIVFTRSKPNKHKALEPHIVMASDPTGKSLIRKTLHHSPFAGSPMNMSPHTKLVSNKFLVVSKARTSPEDSSNDQFPLPTQDHPRRDKPPWNPIPIEDQLFLIPVQQVDSSSRENENPALIETDESEHTPEAGSISSDFDISHETDPEAPDRTSHCPSLQDLDLSDQTSMLSQSQSSTEPDTDPAHGSEILTFNPGEGTNTEEKLIQNRKPKVGDRISFFDARIQTWVDARIIKDLSKRWNHYYNITYDNNIKDGLYLQPNTRWTFLPHEDQSLERSTPCASQLLTVLNPSREPSHSGRIEQEMTSFHEDCAHSSTCAFQDVSDDASLEWDEIGTQLISSSHSSMLYDQDISLESVQCLDLALPVTTPTKSPTLPRSRSHPCLDRVTNLDLVLPLTSTPLQHRPRISTLRRTLPLEVNTQSRFRQFLRRFLPFRKRDP